MPNSERFDLGDRPHVVVSCEGNLEVRGSSHQETRVESTAPDTQIEEIEGGIQVDAKGNCVIRIPPDGSVEIGQVLGNLRLKDIKGDCHADTVNGACYARRVGKLGIDTINGEARLREIAGAVVLGKIAGSVTLRTLDATIAITEVTGDLLGRDIPGGITVDRVSGSLALRSDFRAETVSNIGAVNSVSIRVPSSCNVRFVIPPETTLDLDRSMESHEEDGNQVVQFGDGTATVHITEAESVAIRQRGDYDDETDFAFTFAINEELTDHLAELSERLETKLQGRSQELSERVRRQVERRLESARRQVEAAQRRVDREIARAEVGGRSWNYGVSVGFDDGPTANVEPVSEEERLMILHMLEEGKISVDQAEKLLAALENRG